MASLAGITDFHQIDATLHGYWKLDDSTSGTTVKDSSSYGKNGTLTSTALWTTSANMNDGMALTGGTSGSVSVGILLGHRRLHLRRMGQAHEYFRHPVHRQQQERFIRVFFLALSQRLESSPLPARQARSPIRQPSPPEPGI